MSPTVPLSGVRVLVVEDNFFVAEQFRTALEASGCVVVGPVGRLTEGLRLAEQEPLDCALLDINIHGARSFAIAKVLRGRGLPFVFLSGYDATILPSDLWNANKLDKPINDADLVAAVIRMCQH